MSTTPVRAIGPAVAVVALALALLLAPGAVAERSQAGVVSSARAAASGGAALLAYLNAVDKARASYRVAGPAADTALQNASNTPDATWVTAAAKTKAAEKAAARLESAVKSLTPPPSLEQANKQFAKSAQLATQILGQLSSALGAKNVAAVNTAVAKVKAVTPQIHALEDNWRTAVTAAAHKDHVTVPEWVSTLGTS